MTAGVRGDRPTRALTPPELLRGLATGTDEERTDDGRDPRAADAGWRRGAAIAVLAVAGAGALATSGRVAIGSGANFSESAVISRVADRADGSVGAQGDSAVKTRKFGTDALRGAVVAAALTAGATAQDAVQWRVEDGGNGHWYLGLRYSAQGVSWSSAREDANLIGAELVTFASSAESSWVFSSIASHESMWNLDCGPWVGGYQLSGSAEPIGGWVWVEGRPVGDTFNWAAGQPDDARNCGGDNNRMHYWRQGSAVPLNSLADAPDAASFTCDQGYVGTFRSAIIEWSADCNSDGIVDYGQIRAGQLPDANANNVPDGCECSSFPELPACRCVGDIVADRIVNGADLGTLLSYWGPRTSGSFSIASDLNDNGTIDGADLGMLLSNWGECQPAAVFVPPWATLIEAAPDPAVVTDPALRAAIAATGLAWRVRDTGTDIEMLLVPPGTFQMGCSQGTIQHPCDGMELPVHSVSITRSYYLGRFEVSQSQWTSRTGSNPSTFRGFADSPDRPVETISWTEAKAFLSSAGLRLPTEAEWEYACRAGTSTALSNGSNDESMLDGIAWTPLNSGGETHPTGGKLPNALGLHDMLGNVYEWVNDWYGAYAATSQIDPPGPMSGTHHVARGGAWYLDMISIRSSFRIYGNPDEGYQYIGVRVARNP